jgi:hypoxanthine phosphoribosyltransferase
VIVPTDDLHAGVDRLAGELSGAYRDGVLLVAVLKGSVVFLADLVRSLTVYPEVDFLGITSYAQGTGRVRLVKDLDIDVAGRDVVLVEDVVDTGLTLTWLLGTLERRAPASLATCALVDKTARRLVPVDLAFVGFRTEEDFVLGYGLDFQGRYRNLDLLAAGDLEALRDDPDAHLEELYGGAGRAGRSGAGTVGS